MYRPTAFAEDRPEILAQTIRAHPLGTLITSGESGLLANVVPFTVRERGGQWVLCTHLAKASDQIADLRAGAEALIMFQGPQAYVSPSWYPTKQEHGKVVPTWNYIIVQAWGAPAVKDDPAWLLEQLTEITAAHEGGREQPWGLDDAPAGFIEAQLRGIVGLEIAVSRFAGKWKVSQNQPPRNKAGVVEGLTRDGRSDMARAVQAAVAD